MTERIARYLHDGLTFEVLDQGPIDGEVIVLLHGFPQRATSWAAVAARLNEAGYRTVAPDQRGYSPGARPAGRRAYGLHHLVADAAALIDQAGGGAHVVGHDWGAAVAWSLAGAHPESVRSLTAVSVPHPQAMMRALRTPEQLRRSAYMGFFQLPALPERKLSHPGAEKGLMRGTGMPASAAARYRAEMIDSGALPYALNWYRAMPLSKPKGLGRRVRVRTTHVWSDGDTALGRRGAELSAEYVVDAPYRMEVLGGVSHWIPDEAPDRLAEIVLRQVRDA